MAEKSYDTLFAEYQANLRNLKDGINVDAGTDNWIRGAATMRAVSHLFSYQTEIRKDAFILDASFTALKRHAAPYEMVPDSATTSTGTIVITGTNGTVVGAGLQFTDAEGKAGVTTAGGTIAAGTLAGIAADSIDTGDDVNWPVGTALTLSSPPSGVDAEAEVDGNFSGGDEEQDVDSFRAEFLQRLRQPPAGGRDYDYEIWALAASGVRGAKVFSLRRGLGTCDTCVWGADGAHVSAPVLAAAQAIIDANRPNTAKDCLAIDYTDLTQNFSAQVEVDDDYPFPSWATKTTQAGCTASVLVLNNVTDMAAGDGLLVNGEFGIIASIASPNVTLTEALTAAPAAAKTVYPLPAANGDQLVSAVVNYYLGLEPGDKFVRTKVGGDLGDSDGVTDHSIITPAANVTPAIDSTQVQKVVLGTLAITEM